MIDPVVPQRLLQRVGDMLLPDDLGEGLGTVAAVQREGRHAYEVIGARRQPRRPPGNHRSASDGATGPGAADAAPELPGSYSPPGRSRGQAPARELRAGRPGFGVRKYDDGAATTAPERKRPPRTRQSRPTLAAFRPWGSSVR
ncbi:hypothetical protein SSP531S_54760 [Streptomyces spongiicola]|uniref:Uncharacterized protein n=1 Tax=Streptomyces spongiicola TaxID=1690221 RepID=A0A388T4W3_9ACTN|nr:hypothetical protein SSP531S_54760 [Streptomyces spongiicola]